MDSCRFSRKPCLFEDDNGLDYLANMEARVLGSNHCKSHKQNGFFSRFLCYTRNSGDNNSTRSPRIKSSSVSSPSSRSTSKFYDTRFEERQPHFLDDCFLCKKPLMSNEDIFMYRGDTPFCSVECRYKEIVIDEVNEKRLQLSATLKAIRNKDQRKSTSTSTAKAHEYPITSTIAAALNSLDLLWVNYILFFSSFLNKC